MGARLRRDSTDCSLRRRSSCRRRRRRRCRKNRYEEEESITRGLRDGGVVCRENCEKNTPPPVERSRGENYAEDLRKETSQTESAESRSTVIIDVDGTFNFSKLPIYNIPSIFLRKLSRSTVRGRRDLYFLKSTDFPAKTVIRRIPAAHPCY